MHALRAIPIPAHTRLACVTPATINSVSVSLVWMRSTPSYLQTWPRSLSSGIRAPSSLTIQFQDDYFVFRQTDSSQSITQISTTYSFEGFCFSLTTPCLKVSIAPCRRTPNINLPPAHNSQSRSHPWYTSSASPSRVHHPPKDSHTP